MGNFILKLLISQLIGRIMKNVDLDALIDFVVEAEKQYDNAFAKKGYVYRTIKELEPQDISTTAVNLAIEAGVYYAKRYVFS